MPVRYYRKRRKVNINGQSVYKFVADLKKEEVMALDSHQESVTNN